MLKMRFGSFVWPNNPRTYTLSCKRQTAVHKIPMGGFAVQEHALLGDTLAPLCYARAVPDKTRVTQR